MTVVGHSLGGYSALRLLGSRVDVAGVDAFCTDNEADRYLCTFQAEARFAQLAATADPVHDTRADGVVLLAPAYGPLFDNADLEHLTTPILVVGAANDELLGDQVEELVTRLPDGTSFERVEGGHYSFLRRCSAAEAGAFPELCTDPAGVNRDATAEHLTLLIDQFIQDQ